MSRQRALNPQGPRQHALTAGAWGPKGEVREKTKEHR